MEIVKLHLSRTEISRFSVEEMKFFLAYGKFINDLSILQKLFFMMELVEERTGIEGTMGSIQSMVVVQTMTAKLFEGHQILKKLYSRISQKVTPLLASESKEILRRINRYFNNRENSVALCRNKIAFHYDEDLAIAGYGAIASDHDMTLFLNENYTNSLIFVAEAAMNLGLYEQISPGNPEEAGRILIDETTSLVGWFLQFAGEYFPNAVNRVRDHENPDHPLETIEVVAPKLKEISIPFFVDISEISSEH